MGLSATANGHTFRLRHATFQITGPITTVLDSETDPDAEALVAVLDVGSYSAELRAGWTLERIDPAGPVQVNATLTSPNPVAFDITNGAVTSISFSFATDGQLVNVGQGSVAVSVNVTENGNGRGQLTVLAGVPGGSGSGDGVGPTARFSFPAGVALDGAGNLFVADHFNHTVRKVVLATGEVTTLAGSPGQSGSVDARGADARFESPAGLTSDGAGNLFVADPFNHTIRKIVIATGDVTTAAGLAGVFGTDDGVGVDARLRDPEGMTSDGAGNIYFTDQSGDTIRKLVAATGEVTTIAGTPELFGNQDGVGAAAHFDGPIGITFDGAGTLYIADTFGQTIRKLVLATREVTTIAGFPQTSGSADGIGTDARFNDPWDLTTDGAGNLFVADNFNSTVRKVVIATAEVTTLLGQVGVFGNTDGTGRGVLLGFPQGIIGDGMGHLYIADTDNSTIRKVDIATAAVTTFVGGSRLTGSNDAAGAAARFGRVSDSFSDGAGNLYIADGGNNTIRKVVVATGEVTTIAGTPGPGSTLDGVGAAARFDRPQGVTGDGAGHLFVTDTGGNTIREIDLGTGAVTTLAGTPGVFGTVDGVGAAAQFDSPSGVATDGAGNLFVTSQGDETVRKVVIATGEVITFAGTPGVFGGADGIGTAATFSVPVGIVSDGAGNLYVADSNSDTIRKVVIATAEVSTIAGTAGGFGNADGVGAAAQFSVPSDVDLDGMGNLYVADSGNHVMRKIDLATATVTTVVGDKAISGVLPGALPARLNGPGAVSVLPGDRLAILDENAVLLATF
jgi:hypothetical protein